MSQIPSDPRTGETPGEVPLTGIPTELLQWMFDNGVLLALNRLVLHPIGLAFCVTVEDDDLIRVKAGTNFGIIDSREDPEGFAYGTLNAEKWGAYQKLVHEKLYARQVSGVAEGIHLPSVQMKDLDLP